MARASPSKKQIILSFCAAKKFQVIRRAEMQAIRQELHRQLGDRGTTSAAYIAQVLQQAGQVVEYEDPYVDSSMPEPYASRLKDALHFHNLASAEASLINLHAAYREYQRANDRASRGCNEFSARESDAPKVWLPILRSGPRNNVKSRKSPPGFAFGCKRQTSSLIGWS